jgi:hypothetical protein
MYGCCTLSPQSSCEEQARTQERDGRSNGSLLDT